MVNVIIVNAILVNVILLNVIVNFIIVNVILVNVVAPLEPNQPSSVSGVLVCVFLPFCRRFFLLLLTLFPGVHIKKLFSSVIYEIPQ